MSEHETVRSARITNLVEGAGGQKNDPHNINARDHDHNG